MKQGIIDEIIKIFGENLGWKVYGFGIEADSIANKIDGQLQINTNEGAFHLVYEIKKSVIPASIPAIKEGIQTLDLQRFKAQGAILLSNYISTKARKLLYQNNINYADTGGNISIRYKGVHIYIETGKSDRAALRNDGGRAFTKTGLKVLYQFFKSNSRSGDKVVDINSSYKNIALQATVSKDTVSKVMLDLLEQGYLLRKNSSEFIWKEKRIVFERWVSRINETLRPSLMQRKYRLIGESINSDNFHLGYQFGGYHGVQQCMDLESSLQVINAPYLIYVHKRSPNEIVQDLKIVPDVRGNVTVVNAFWLDDSKVPSSVDFPILYADLISTGDPRMLDIAHLLFKKHIDDHL